MVLGRSLLLGALAQKTTARTLRPQVPPVCTKGLCALPQRMNWTPVGKDGVEIIF